MKDLFVRKKEELRQMAHGLLSESLVRKIRYRNIVKSKGNQQKYWFGGVSELSASPLEAKYFQSHVLRSTLFHCADDYRPAGFISGRVTLQISTDEKNQGVQFALAPVGNRAVSKVFVELGDEKILLKDLKIGAWNEVRITRPSDGLKSVTLDLGEGECAITMPRNVRLTSPADDTRPRHVIVLVLDAFSTSILGAPHPLRKELTCSPNIDRFFKQGYFASGVSSGEWTLPSVSSLFTGLFSSNHGAYHPKRWQELPPNRDTLFEMFQKAGFKTLCASVVDSLTPAFGHARGVDRFLYHVPFISSQNYDTTKWISALVSVIDSHFYDKTFTYFQFPDTHPSWNYTEPDQGLQYSLIGDRSFTVEKWVTGEDLDLDPRVGSEQMYKLRLLELDRLLGQLFDYLEVELSGKYVVAVTSDHGITMPYLTEAEKRSVPYLIERKVGIPCFIRGAGVPVARVEETIMPSIDLPVTLATLVGLPLWESFDGCDLMKFPKRDFAISESFFRDVYEIAVRYENWVFISKFPTSGEPDRITTLTPLFEGLFQRDWIFDPLKDESKREPKIFEKLKTAALDHIKKSKSLLAQ